jgi:N-acetylglucosaminyl-diphospho-decaprenol L-rhamnosyltransferase
VDDLAIVIVSHGDERWLPACLTTARAACAGLAADIVVVDNHPDRGSLALVAAQFPEVRAVGCPNRGFAHANNVGLATCDARYVAFLNPDTEVVSGSFTALVEAMDVAPRLGLAGVRQTRADGTLQPTIRRFPNAARTLCEVLGAERLPWPGAPLGERELRWERYDREVRCDWTSGSFMLARREALAGAGLFDERFFFQAEEVDLCLRIARSGWEIRHLPAMTIVHHAGKAGISPRRQAQDMYSRLQYARKHFSPAHRVLYRLVLMLRQLTRAARPGEDAETARLRRAAAGWSLRVLSGISGAPFGAPPAVAVTPEPPA